MTVTDTEPTAPATEVPPPGKRPPGRPKGSKTRGGNGDTTPKPAPPTAGGRSPGRPSSIDKLAEHLQAQFAGLGLLVFAFNPTVGGILVEDSEAHGKALAALAEQNPKIRKMLEGGVTGSAWVGVAIAFGSTGMKVSRALREQGAAEAATEPAPNPFAQFMGAEAPGGQ